MAGPIRISVLANASAARRELTGLGRDATTMGDRFARAGRAVAIGAGVGLLAAAAVTAKLGVATTRLASDAEQSLGATETVFGRYADNVTRASERAATSVGLSANEYRESANLIGSLLGNQGVATDQLAGKTDRLVKIGADLAATFGGTTRESVEALGSAFKGEFDPLERYGISVKQSTVNTEALRVANVKSTSAFESLSTAQQTAAKQQATTNLILAQSSKASGAFARETDTLAGQQQRLTAQTQNLGATIGTGLTPGLTTLGKVVNRDVLPPLQSLAEEYAPKVGRALGDLAEQAGPRLQQVLTNLPDAFDRFRSSDAAGTVGEIAGSLAELRPVAEATLPILADGLQVTATVLRVAAENSDVLARALPVLAAGYVAVKTATLASNIAKAAEVALNRAVTTSSTQVAGAHRAEAAAVSRIGLAARGAAGIGGLGALAVGASTSNDALGTLANVGGGALTGFAVGGPIGAAIGGSAGLLLSLATNAGKAEDAAVTGAAKWAAYAQTLDQVTGSTTEQTRVMALQELQQNGGLAALEAYGVTARQAVDNALGLASGSRAVAAALGQEDAMIGALITQRAELRKAPINSTADAQANNAMIASISKEIDERRAAASAVRAQAGAVADSVRGKREEIAATRDYTGLLKGLPRDVRTEINANGLEPTLAGIRTLGNRYDLTPKQVQTLVKATGIDATGKQVRGLIKNLEATDKTRANLRAYVDSTRQGVQSAGKAAKSGATGVRRDLESVDRSRANLGRYLNDVGQGMSKARASAQRGGDQTREAAERGPAAARANLSGMNASVSAGLASVRSTAASGGSSVGTALKQGIEGGFAGVVSSLTNTAAAAVNSAIAAARRAARSNSPSKEMMDVGKDLALGGPIGMDAERHRWSRAGGDLSRGALRGAQDALKRQPVLRLGLDETFARSRGGSARDRYLDAGREQGISVSFKPAVIDLRLPDGSVQRAQIRAIADERIDNWERSEKARAGM